VFTYHEQLKSVNNQDLEQIKYPAPCEGAEVKLSGTIQFRSAPSHGVGGLNASAIYKHVTPNGVKPSSPPSGRLRTANLFAPVRQASFAFVTAVPKQ
jgi:hypothetical protein